MKILHIFNDPKFSKPYFEFLTSRGFSISNHSLVHYRSKKEDFFNFDFSSQSHCIHFFSPLHAYSLLIQLQNADKVIIHCLASPVLLIYLAMFPNLAKKCYWVIWGKDLYFYKMLDKPRFHHKVYEFFRRRAIKNIQYVITDNKEDINLAKAWYGINAKQFPSFAYPSNLYKNHLNRGGGSDLKKTARCVILIGNSADPSNNHLDIFELLKPFKDRDIQLITPLSYGDKRYAQRIEAEGKSIFGEKFTPIMSLIAFPEYIDMLTNVDMAVFAHKRQQAMGNIITLLGMGKSVYLRSDITTWHHLTEKGIHLGNIKSFELQQFDNASIENNIKQIKNQYSEEVLESQWREIFQEPM